MHEPTRPGWKRRARGAVERALLAGGRRAERLGPGPATWRGATIGLAVSVAVLFAVHGGWLLWVTGAERGSLYTVLVVGALIALVGPALSLLAWLAQWLVLKPARSVPVAYRWASASAFLAVSFAFTLEATRRGMLIIVLLFVAGTSLLGAGLRMTFGRRDSGLPEGRGPALLGHALGVATLFAGLLLVSWQVAWLASDGPGEAPRRSLAAVGAASVRGLGLPNPGQPGPFAVRTLTYGSGRDPQRPEYGSEADLVTSSVDGLALVDDWGPDLAGLARWPARVRARFFGCDARSLPLQGRVWYPDRAEPSPLVLMVHGNHLMSEFSDTGYDYLGELLASRGFIFVSVDQNFLNTNPAMSVGLFLAPLGIQLRDLVGELDARAWLLLEHLRVWRDWNAAGEGPFAGRVDMGRIALAGHSFGGEAAALAAVFNRLSALPDNARVRFDYGFDIRAVIAVAPVDGRYRPAGRLATPRGVDYFTLHGSHDADVQSFEGAKLYQRITLADTGPRGEPLWKSALYVHRANHGMFNRSWGRHDMGMLPGRVLDVQPLLDASDQEKIARVFIGAFLEATLNGRLEYKALFRDYRAGREWLPETVYLQRYGQSGDQMLCTFEEDVELSTATVPGGRLSTGGLQVWREQPLRMKRGELGTQAVLLGWRRGSGDTERGFRSPYFQLELPAEGVTVDPRGALLLSLADARGAAGGVPLDMTLLLTDAAGAEAALPLGHFGALQPALEARLMKTDLMRSEGRSEMILQDFELPFAAFAAAAPEFDPARLASVRIVFDRSPVGTIVLDDLGLRGAHGAD